MVSSAFKSAYQNEVSQQNQMISNATSPIRDAVGLAAASIGAKIVGRATRLKGIGGQGVADVINEKVESANEDSRKLFTSEQIGETISSTLGTNPINNTAKKQLSTVFETLTKAKEDKIINEKGKIESSLGDIDPNSDLGKQILKQSVEQPKMEKKEDYKDQQLKTILKNNPVNDDYHTWIRSKEDIKTFEESMQNKDDLIFTPDYTEKDANNALKSGEITIYSSNEIKPGVFVTPSQMEASQYSGGDTSKLFKKTVKLKDIAWIDNLQGQYTKEDK